MMILIPDARFEGMPVFEQEGAGPEVEIRVHRVTDAAAIPDEDWRACDGVLLWGRLRFDEDVLRRLERCRIVTRMGVGFDVIDLAACGARGIAACNVPDYGTTDVADHAIGLMLALTRGIVGHHERLRNDPVGHWRAIDTPIVRRIRGTVFGIVGLGRIGTAAGLRAAAFGMEVAFYDPYLPDGAELALGFERVDSLEALLGRADVVSLHTPLTGETKRMIDDDAFAAMKEDAILINTSRGEVVDLDAADAALREGRIAALALDVLPDEPPNPDHPLIRAHMRRESWTEGRLILTPHAAWFSPEGSRDLRVKAARNTANYLRDGVLRNCVNREYLKERNRP